MLTYLWRMVVCIGLVVGLGAGGVVPVGSKQPLARPAQLTTTAQTPAISQPVAGTEDNLLQLRAAGHLAGFGSTGWHLTNGKYALGVTFVGAKPVIPTSLGAALEVAPTAGQAPAALTQVTYRNLWPGVTLAYAADEGGIMRSTYTLAPQANVQSIRLRYNVPVVQTEEGDLRLNFAVGAMDETAPIAWQEVNGQRQAVAVRFVVKEAQEVGFALGAYNPALPVVIDPLLRWNTFLGGTGSDVIYGMTTDNSGFVYVVGYSDATWGTPVQAHAGGSDGFLAKLNGNTGALVWHTFFGSTNSDTAYGVEVDNAGSNVYVVGLSYATWGAPQRPFYGNSDVVVVRFDAADGVRSWNTFLGSTDFESTLWAIDLDSSNNIYVGGASTLVWGNPVATHTVGSNYDAFVAKLTSTGALNWNTFMGSTSSDYIFDLVTDGTYVYVAGYSNASWGTPTRPYNAGNDAFMARVSASNGVFGANSFLGGAGSEIGYGITLSGGAVFVAGYSTASWGNPVRPYSPTGADAFVARTTLTGTLAWNTFLGGGTTALFPTATTPTPADPLAQLPGMPPLGIEGGGPDDYAYNIVADTAGNLYVAGISYENWGIPARRFSVGPDSFVVRLNGSTGAWGWQTFLGGNSNDYSYAVATVATTTVFVGGFSNATWGGPVRPFTSGSDGFVARLNANYENFIPMPIRAMTMGLPISQSFTGGVVPPTGWSLVANNSSTWQIASGQGYNDSFAAKVVAASGQDEVLISPFLFTASSANVSFYSRGNASCIGSTACDLKVWLVVGGWASGTKTLLTTADETWPGEYIWTHTTVSAPTNFQTAQIAFEFINAGVANVYLDDISITMGP